MKTIQKFIRRAARTAVLAVVAAMLSTGCAGPRYTLSPTVGDKQQVRVENGKTVIESTGKHLVSVRVVEPRPFAKQRMKFLVAVGNQGDEPIAFSPSNVSVRLDEQPLKVFTYEELQKELADQAAAMAAVSMVYAANASMNASFAQYHLNAATAPNTSLGTSLNHLNAGMPYAQQADSYNALATQMEMASLSSVAQLSNLEAILRPTAIMPKEVGGGVVVTQGFLTPTPHVLKLNVNAEGELHEFLFNLDKPQKK